MYCIYRHIRLDINEVFYIGIGSLKRPYWKYHRSKYWNNIINKTEYEIDILKKDLSWHEACELEKILISYYGRKDLKTGCLVNMTNGGDGVNGVIFSEEHKIKLKIARNKRIISEETKNKQRLSFKLNTSKKVIDINNNKIYKSIKEAASSINMKPTTLAAKLRGQSFNNTNFKYI